MELFVSETNIYVQQYRCNFFTTSEEMKAFLGVNFIVGLMNYQENHMTGIAMMLLETLESRTYLLVFRIYCNTFTLIMIRNIRNIITCTSLVKFYNKDMRSVDLTDQKTAAYRLDRRSSHRFYFRIFFDLMGMTLLNSHIVYQQLNGNLNLLDFKVIIANSLIVKYSNRQRAFPQGRPGTTKRKCTSQAGLADTPNHLPEYQVSRHRVVCKNGW